LLEQLVAADPALPASYAKARSYFLEDRVATLFKTFLHPTHLYRNVSMRRGNREIGETDLLATIDHYAFIVEAKSSRISPSARRGALLRLNADITTLIADPS